MEAGFKMEERSVFPNTLLGANNSPIAMLCVEGNHFNRVHPHLGRKVATEELVKAEEG